MATDAISTFRSDTTSLSLGVRLHDWVTTVDHKRLGILYIVYSLVFLILGGIEATILA